MGTINMDARKFRVLCKKWGFIEKRQGDHLVMQLPSSGNIVALRRGGGEINDHTLTLAAEIVGVSRPEFLAGPKKPSPLSPSRKKVIFWLDDHGGTVKDSSGRVVDKIATDTGFNIPALGALLRDMEADEQIVRHVAGRRTKEIVLVKENPEVNRVLKIGSSDFVSENPSIRVYQGDDQPVDVDVQPAESSSVSQAKEISPRDIADSLLDIVIETIRSSGRPKDWEEREKKLLGRINQTTEYAQSLRKEKDSFKDRIDTLEAGNKKLVQKVSELQHLLSEKSKDSRIVPNDILKMAMDRAEKNGD